MGLKPFASLPGLVLSFALAFSTMPASYAPAETASLKMQHLPFQSSSVYRQDDPDFLYRMVYSQYFRYQAGQIQVKEIAEFGETVKKEPAAYLSKYPFRGVVKFGSQRFGFVFDSRDVASNGYDKLYFDLNGNGDLTDDKALEAAPPPSNVNYGQNSARREYPRILLTIDGDGEKIEYGFFFSIYSRYNEQNQQSPVYGSASLRSASYRTGEIPIDGKKHRIVILDFNSNGRFNDEFSVNLGQKDSNNPLYPSSGDMVLVDPDTRNRSVWGSGALGRSERQNLSKLLNIDGRFFNIEVSPTGDTVTLTPSPLATGSVNNPNSQYDAIVYGDHGLLKISGVLRQPVALPVGNWKLLQYRITEATAKKPTYVSASATQDYPTVQVEKGKNAILPFGPPYKPLVRTSLAWFNSSGATVQRLFRLSLALTGSQGEICTDLRVAGKRPEKPTFVIATNKGKIIERGSFEYG